jgi:hypothetical protein
VLKLSTTTAIAVIYCCGAFLIMYYQEKVINGILCCKHSPNGEWIELAKQTLTERLMKYKKALQIIQNFDEDDENEYGDPGVVASEALSF